MRLVGAVHSQPADLGRVFTDHRVASSHDRGHRRRGSATGEKAARPGRHAHPGAEPLEHRELDFVGSGRDGPNTREEVEAWKQKGPINRFMRYLEDESILTPDILEDYETRARAEVDRAQAAAEAAPYPEPEAALGDVYAPLEDES